MVGTGGGVRSRGEHVPDIERPGVKGNDEMNTDWTSRILALASLIISLGAVAFQVSQDQAAKEKPSNQTELLAQFKDALDKQAADYQQKQKDLEDQYLKALDLREKRFGEWNETLGDALSKFNTDAKDLLDQVALDEQKASDERRTVFRQQLADLAGPSSETAASESASPEATATEAAGDKATEDAGPALQGPSPAGTADEASVANSNVSVLQLVNTVFRPTSADSMLITLRNDSDRDAVIDRIRFQPKKDFKAPQPAAPSEAATSGKLTTVRFTAAHNMSTKQGYHGLYSQKLASPIRVPSKGTATIRVLIEDGETPGWGLAGRLFLDYNSADKKPLQVNEAHVVFESPSGSI